jgi:hypothetical protein
MYPRMKSKNKNKSKSKDKAISKRQWISESVFQGCDNMPNQLYIDAEARKFLKKSSESNDIPKAFVTFGFPGSGKSTMALNYLGLNHKYTIASTDEVIEKLNEYNDGINVKLNDGTIIGSKDMFMKCENIAGTIASSVFYMAMENNLNLLVDFPYASINDLLSLKRYNYYITSLYVMRRYKTIKKAIENRANETGRFLSDDIFSKENYNNKLSEKSFEIANAVKYYCDEFYICVNDSGITIPSWAQNYLTKIIPPKLQKWTIPSDNYLVDTKKISIGELTRLLLITKNI